MNDSFENQPISRRQTLLLAAGGTASLLLGGRRLAAAEPMTSHSEADESGHEEVTANEDLMRDHGVLRRYMLVLEAAIPAATADPKTAAQAVRQSAQTIQRFVEQYHEKAEELYIFPLFKEGEMAKLTQVLTVQHNAGKPVTAKLLTLASEDVMAKQEGRDELRRQVTLLTTMYRPHAAREDTVVFQLAHEMLSEKQYDDLSETLERHEHKIIGENGYKEALEQVAQLEKSLGIYDLEKFTPPNQPKG